MPITIQWDNDIRTTIVMRYQSGYTWEELDTVTNTMYDMLNSVSHDVCLLVILDPAVKSPKGNMMARMGSIINNTPKNLTLQVIVGNSNPFSRAIANTMMRVYRFPFKIITVSSEAKAREILAEHQPKLLTNR